MTGPTYACAPPPVTKTLRAQQYFALLAVADGCLVTSQRDGMNLTAHEFVACQQEKHSPLILSEFAGTYGSLGGALRINPWDIQVGPIERAFNGRTADRRHAR